MEHRARQLKKVEVWDDLGWIIAKGSVSPADACRTLASTLSNDGPQSIFFSSPPSFITCALTSVRGSNNGGRATFKARVLSHGITNDDRGTGVSHGSASVNETDATRAPPALEAAALSDSSGCHAPAGAVGDEDAKTLPLSREGGVFDGIDDLLFSPRSGSALSASSPVASGDGSMFSSLDGGRLGSGNLGSMGSRGSAAGCSSGGTDELLTKSLKPARTVVAVKSNSSQPTPGSAAVYKPQGNEGQASLRGFDQAAATGSVAVVNATTPGTESGNGHGGVAPDTPVVFPNASPLPALSSSGSDVYSDGFIDDDEFDSNREGTETDLPHGANSLFSFSSASSFDDNGETTASNTDDENQKQQRRNELAVTLAATRLRRRLRGAAEKLGGGHVDAGAPLLFDRLDVVGQI